MKIEGGIRDLLLVLLFLLAAVPARTVSGQPIPESGRQGEVAGSLAQARRAIAEKNLDWEAREYDRDFALGAILDEAEARGVELSPRDGMETFDPALDWRDRGGNFVSPVKDQADCGSCWAFAAVAALESAISIVEDAPGQFLNLSEQILVSCCAGNYGCSGGFMSVTAQFMRNEGTAEESCFPYTATNNDCSNACSSWRDGAYRISSYSAVSRDVTALKTALQSGPLPVSFVVYSDFRSYGSGVYEYASGTQEGGHAVLLVGYQDTPGQYDGGYFIVKNSWGTGWGENGYFRIGYSQVTNSVSFGRNAYFYSCGGSPAVTPTPPPAISLCVALDRCDLRWTTGGTGSWYGQGETSYDGVDAAQSAAIPHYQDTWFETAVVGPGELSFWWKSSSETYYDFLEFYIDGIRRVRVSGEIDWQEKSYALDSGQHTLRWNYSKDGSVSTGSDCGWVDRVVWTGSAAEPTPTPAVYPGPPPYITDYDGDGTSDIGIFRPSSGLWAIRGVTWTYWGGNGDIPVPADYNANGTTDIGAYRPATGYWFIKDLTKVFWGKSGDIPVPGDYRGGGTAEIGVFRPSSGLWAIRGVTRAFWGRPGDLPVTR